MNTLRLSFSALYRTLRIPGLSVALYAVTLLITLPPGLAFRNMLQTAMADSGAYEVMLSDFHFTVFNDFMRQNRSGVLTLMNAAMMSALFFVPLSSFLAGGILTTLGSVERRFSLTLFFSGCAQYFGRFLRLLLIFTAALIVLFSLVAIVFGVLITVATTGGGSEIPIIGMAVAGAAVLSVLFLLLVMVADYAKVIAVETSSSHMVSVAAQAVRFVWKNFFRTLLLHLILITVALFFVVVYWYLESVIGMVSPLTILFTALLQQVFIVGRSWLRVTFFAAELGWYQSVVLKQSPFIDTPPPPVEPAPLYA